MVGGVWLGPTSAQSRGIPEPELLLTSHRSRRMVSETELETFYGCKCGDGDVWMMIPGAECRTPLEMQICACGCHGSCWVPMMDVTRPRTRATRASTDYYN